MYTVVGMKDILIFRYLCRQQIRSWGVGAKPTKQFLSPITMFIIEKKKWGGGDVCVRPPPPSRFGRLYVC